MTLTDTQLAVLFDWVSATAKTDELFHGRYGPRAARKVLPYLIGYGATVRQIAGCNVFEKEEIEIAVKSHRVLRESSTVWGQWNRWCTGLGTSPRDVETGYNLGDVKYTGIVMAMRGWCAFLGVPDWRSVRTENGLQPPTAHRRKGRGDKQIGMTDVITAVTSVMRLGRDEMESSRRHPQVTMARAITATACRTLIPTASYPDIHTAMNIPNHSSTITGHAWFTAVWDEKHSSHGGDVTTRLRSAWCEVMDVLGVSGIHPMPATARRTLESMCRKRKTRAVYVG